MLGKNEMKNIFRSSNITFLFAGKRTGLRMAVFLSPPGLSCSEGYHVKKKCFVCDELGLRG